MSNYNTINIQNSIDFDIPKEYLKCKLSPLYFMENYINIPVAGGVLPMRESELWHSTPKYKQLAKAFADPKVDNIIHMASRQHGKTTTIAGLTLHHLLFYERFKAQFLTLTKDNAFDVIERLKFMYEYLPKWMKIPMKDKGGKKTYIEFENGSKFQSKYISGNIDPDSIGRGFSSPFAWVDEAAFIPHMETAWAAMQPAISAARLQAKKNNYPTKIILTSTPNGAGDNFFYNVWQRAWDSEEVFETTEENQVGKIKENVEEILNSQEDRNNFVKIRIHWSETGKTKEWYQKQVKELNFNMRKVNQEINLVFLGSAYSVFDDAVLAEFEPGEEKKFFDLGYGQKFKLFDEIDHILQENPDEIFLLGVDTAVSTAAKADYSALCLTRASTGEQIGEWHGKVSVLKRYALMVKKLILSLSALYSLDEDNLKVVIERNSIGLGVIEELTYDDNFDYNSYIVKTEIRKGERAPGLMTRKDTREKMFELLLSMMNENPKLPKGPILQEELRNLEQKSNGRIEAGKGQHDDVVMAYNFTLFIRNELIKKGEISPDISDKTISNQRKTKEKIMSAIDAAFTSLSRETSKLSKFEVQFEYDERAQKKKEKELKEILKPKILKSYDDEDEMFYTVI